VARVRKADHLRGVFFVFAVLGLEEYIADILASQPSLQTTTVVLTSLPDLSPRHHNLLRRSHEQHDRHHKRQEQPQGPSANSGLLHRYSFVTWPLIVAVLLVVGLLIPTLVLTVSALTSVEVPYGLTTKMHNGPGEAKKD
jgi:hypothetical protein